MEQNQINETAYSESIKLPSLGLLYSTDHPLHNIDSVEITPMTTLGEDILTSKSLIKKGKVVDKLLKSCLVNKFIEPENMYTFDRNSLFIALRMISYGTDYEVKLKCQNEMCEKTFNHMFDLNKLTTDYFDIELTKPDENYEFSFILPKSGKKIKFRFLTGQDDYDLSQIEDNVKNIYKNQGEMISHSISTQWIHQITEIDGNRDKTAISLFVRKMLAIDSIALRNYIKSISPGLNLDFEIECPFCGNKFDMVLPMTKEFFWPSI